MSEEILAPIVTVAILLGLAFWAPTLHFCATRCQQWLSLDRYKAGAEADAREFDLREVA